MTVINRAKVGKGRKCWTSGSSYRLNDDKRSDSLHIEINKKLSLTKYKIHLPMLKRREEKVLSHLDTHIIDQVVKHSKFLVHSDLGTVCICHNAPLGSFWKSTRGKLASSLAIAASAMGQP